MVSIWILSSTKPGYRTFCDWKNIWSKNGSSEANMKTFLADRYMPFWVRCNTCQKWRQVSKDTDFTSDYVRDFVCEKAPEVRCPLFTTFVFQLLTCCLSMDGFKFVCYRALPFVDHPVRYIWHQFKWVTWNLWSQSIKKIWFSCLSILCSWNPE